jgi:peroxiredoxin
MKKFILVLILVITNQSFGQLKVGNKAPDFKLWTIDNNTITKKETANKVVVLKFWFTSCVPCITGIPTLNKLVKKYKDRDDILFIAPALDNKEKIQRFLSYYPFDFKITYNAIDVAQIYNPKGIYPTYVIIDKNGYIAYVDSQTKEINETVLEQEIKKLIK